MSLPELLARSYTRGSRYLEHGPRHFLMYIFGRFRLVRLFMVGINSRRPSGPALELVPAHIEDIDVDSAVRNICRNGFFSGLQLRSHVVEQLLSFSSVATCFGDGKACFPFTYVHKADAEEQAAQTFKVGRYNQALQTCSTLQALAADRKLRAIARGYLRAEPVLLGARMWWSFASPTDTKRQMELGQGFHYDIDGYRGLTFFFYLTDVGPLTGPHVYVRGSHMTKPLKYLISIYKGRSDAEIEKWYGRERQVVLCGPAGFGFAEDIFGFHKGLHPETGDRLIVQVRYGLRDYGTGWKD